MTDITTTRDVSLIAQEINRIKEDTRKTMIRASIEIGRRLHEAKSMVPYGEWGRWLETNVDYSESTAQNLMRIADEYGRKESQALADISYTQAVALLRLPAEEREQFVQEHDMETMSTREMIEEIKRLNEENAKKQLTIDEMLGLVPAAQEDKQPEPSANDEELQGMRDQLQEAEKIAEEEQARAKELEKALINARQQVLEAEKRREDDLRKVQAKAETAEKERDEARKAAKANALQLQRTEEELEAARNQVRTVEVLPENIQAELDALRSKASQSAAESAMRAAYECWSSDFERLMEKTEEAAKVDAVTAGRFREAFHKTMLQMAQRMAEG